MLTRAKRTTHMDPNGIISIQRVGSVITLEYRDG
jgi:hypothetical protein